MKHHITFIFVTCLLIIQQYHFQPSLSQTYLEFVNRDYTLIYDNDEIQHEAPEARSYCTGVIGTDLASFPSFYHLATFWALLKSINIYDTRTCWLGLEDTSSTETSSRNWEWFDRAYDWNLTDYSDYYDFNGQDQQCTYHYPGQSQINDWYCTGNELVGNNQNSWEVSYCWLCNKPPTRIYTISLTVDDYNAARTGEIVYFRIQGNIANVTESETWTEWTTNSGFQTVSGTFTWNVTLDNVGPAIQLIVLMQGDNNFAMSAVGVDGVSVDVNGYVLDYNDGPPDGGDGCSFIIVDLITGLVDDQTTTYTDTGDICPYHNELPTTEPTPRPTPSPTNPIPTYAPTPKPTVDPTPRPTDKPTSVPTDPTNEPTMQPTPKPTIAPTERPTDKPTDEPTKKPTSDPTPRPTDAPTKKPTKQPTNDPTPRPTYTPTSDPTVEPTKEPTNDPTTAPTRVPSDGPTSAPSNTPTVAPTGAPVDAPSTAPTDAPSDEPTGEPTREPTKRTVQIGDDDGGDSGDSGNSDDSGDSGDSGDGSDSGGTDGTDDGLKSQTDGGGGDDVIIYIIVGSVAIFFCAVIFGVVIYCKRKRDTGEEGGREAINMNKSNKMAELVKTTSDASVNMPPSVAISTDGPKKLTTLSVDSNGYANVAMASPTTSMTPAGDLFSNGNATLAIPRPEDGINTKLTAAQIVALAESSAVTPMGGNTAENSINNSNYNSNVNSNNEESDSSESMEAMAQIRAEMMGQKQNSMNFSAAGGVAPMVKVDSTVNVESMDNKKPSAMGPMLSIPSDYNSFNYGNNNVNVSNVSNNNSRNSSNQLGMVNNSSNDPNSTFAAFDPNNVGNFNMMSNYANYGNQSNNVSGNYGGSNYNVNSNYDNYNNYGNYGDNNNGGVLMDENLEEHMDDEKQEMLDDEIELNGITPLGPS